MTRIPDFLLTREVEVDPFLGRSMTGPVYGDTFTAPCLRSDKRRLTRGADGRQATADLQLYLAPEFEGKVPVESRVRIDGREATVLEVREHLHPDLPTPDHVHLVCG